MTVIYSDMMNVGRTASGGKAAQVTPPASPRRGIVATRKSKMRKKPGKAPEMPRPSRSPSPSRIVRPLCPLSAPSRTARLRRPSLGSLRVRRRPEGDTDLPGETPVPLLSRQLRCRHASCFRTPRAVSSEGFFRHTVRHQSGPRRGHPKADVVVWHGYSDGHFSGFGCSRSVYGSTRSCIFEAFLCHV